METLRKSGSNRNVFDDGDGKLCTIGVTSTVGCTVGRHDAAATKFKSFKFRLHALTAKTIAAIIANVKARRLAGDPCGDTATFTKAGGTIALTRFGSATDFGIHCGGNAVAHIVEAVLLAGHCA